MRGKRGGGSNEDHLNNVPRTAESRVVAAAAVVIRAAAAAETPDIRACTPDARSRVERQQQRAVEVVVEVVLSRMSSMVLGIVSYYCTNTHWLVVMADARAAPKVTQNVLCKTLQD